MTTMKTETIEMTGTWMRTLALIGTVGLAGCGAEAADGAVEEANSQAFERIVNVEVHELAPEAFVEEIRLTAAVMANQDVMISAQEQGVVRELFVDRGDWVAKDAPIAKLDDRVLAAQVQQAQAAASLAEQTWDRRKRLWEEDQVGSEIAYLEAKFASEQTAASLMALQERLKNTTVRAPFAGVMDERHVEVGSMVGSGQTVGRLVDLNPVRVMAGVPERYAPDVKVGATAQMTFDVMPGEVFESTIRYVGASVSPANRTFPIEVVLSNPNSMIKPQMVANMAVTRRALDAAIVVPQDALVRVEDGYVAFVASGDRAEQRVVVLGPTRRNLVVIEDGLVAGDRLIVVGQKSVAAGDRINVVGDGN